MQTLFWILFFLLFYTYIGYGLFLVLYNVLFKKKKIYDDGFQPPVTILVPAYNEEPVIRQKIENSLALNYPAEKLFFVFITDGSTDNTKTIISQFPQIILLHEAKRAGKSAAINRAMQQITTPIIILTDANTMLHPQSIQKMVRHFGDEKVGGVSGEKRIADKTHSPVGFGEKLYWQYESLLKKANAGFYTIIGAAGELFAIRRSLFTPVKENIILDDFVISAQICQAGYRFLYEEEAYAVETSSASLLEERKRKIRISAGCYQALFSLPGLLNPFNNFRIAFQYISHRVLRWTVCPLSIPVLFLINFYLFLTTGHPVYTFLFWGQVFFYMLALVGWMLSAKKIRVKLLMVPAYFLFMILSQYAGFFRFIGKKQTVFWEKADRKSLTA